MAVATRSPYVDDPTDPDPRLVPLTRAERALIGYAVGRTLALPGCPFTAEQTLAITRKLDSARRAPQPQ